MHPSLSQYVLWILCTVAMLVILVAMVRRHLLDEYSLFFWYIAAHVFEAIVSLVARQVSNYAYFFIYWSWELIDAVFTLIVLQFIFVKVFDSYKVLHGLGVTLFRWTTIVLCIFAVISAIYAPADVPASGIQAGLVRLDAGMMVMERSIQLIQLGLLLCLLLCSRLFGLPWRHYIYGINLGFGIYASFALILSAIRAEVGSSFTLWNRLIGVTYTLGVFIWTYYFVSEKAVEASAHPPSSAQLQQWNDALAQMLHRSDNLPPK